MDKKGYKELRVWQLSIALVPGVYKLLKRFPPEENYALASQIRRAAVSIPANIAEGQARAHLKEFLYHLSVAKGSLAELHTLFIISARLDYIDAKELLTMEEELSQIAKTLHGLITALRSTG